MVEMRKLAFEHFKFSACTGILILLTLILYSHVHYVAVIWSFVVGLGLCYFAFSKDTLLPNLLFMLQRKRKNRRKDDDEFSLLKKVCPVCGESNCPRHRPELNILALQPWTDLMLPERVDTAIEEFLTLVLKNYVYTWYRDVGEDEAFVDELKTSIRFMAAILLRRIKKVDIPTLVTEKLVPAGVRHVDCYLQARNSYKKGDIQQVTLDLMGSHLHIAMRSRAAELQYLRQIADNIFPYILSAQSLQCRSLCSLLREILASSILLPVMDVIADPDIVNKLLLVFFDDTPPPVCLDPPSTQVTILANFSVPLSRNCSSLHIESVADIMNNQEALYPFMQFLKREASVNVLMFCLAAGWPLSAARKFLPEDEESLLALEELNGYKDFNRKILNPDLTSVDLQNLHTEVNEMFGRYCAFTSVDKIQFDDDIISELQRICDGPPEGVKRLQVTTPLFRAYEHAYNLLENTFLPLFHQSDDYYIWLCGNRHSKGLFRSASRDVLEIPANKKKKKKNNKKLANQQFGLSKIGNRLKGVFRSNTVEGKYIDGIPYTDAAEDLVGKGQTLAGEGKGPVAPATPPVTPRRVRALSLPVLDMENTNSLMDRRLSNIAASDTSDEMLCDNLFDDPKDAPLRDLSSWRVEIPSIEEEMDPESRKKFHSFLIDVRRLDILEEAFSSWVVKRRYNEFYILEQKLKEFHGEFADVKLPNKKTLGTKGADFMESKRVAFEKYLQALLTKPTLKGSEMLFNFLTSDNELTTSFLPDLNLGKMFRSVPIKLQKERGQHLEPFLTSFVTSCDAPKPRPSRMEDGDSDTVSISSENLANPQYDNNAGMDLDLNPEYVDPGICSSDITGVLDTVIYVAKSFYHVPKWFQQVLMTIRMLGRNTVDNAVDWYIGQKLSQVTKEHRIVNIVHLLRDVLFFDDDPPRTEKEKLMRKQETLREFKKFIPKILPLVVGPDKFDEGSKCLFEVIQQPKLNKQLTYVFLDMVLEELFPELLEEANEDCDSLSDTQQYVR
ncbi:sorting nexin-14-like isoform X3 [Lineus longissimus]|uniref:sorting nexin-14-like isoform X3 n=1 Tax=Lineus longissimus TaxID=88925 RepID=UPI00315D5A9E